MLGLMTQQSYGEALVPVTEAFEKKEVGGELPTVWICLQIKP